MAAIDAAAPEPVEVLIERAGRGGRPRGRVRPARRDLRPAGRGRRGQGQQRQRRARARRGGCAARGVRVDRLDAADARRAALPRVRPGDRRRLRHRLPGHRSSAPAVAAGHAGAGGRHPVRRRRPHRRGGRGRVLRGRPHGDLRRRSSPACCSSPARRCAGAIEVADIGLDVSAAPGPPGDRGDVGALAARAARPTPTSGSAPCGSWPAARAWPGAAALAAPGPSGPAPATCGSSTPGGGGRRPARCPTEVVHVDLPAGGLGRRRCSSGLDRFRAVAGRQRPGPGRRRPPARSVRWSPAAAGARRRRRRRPHRCSAADASRPDAGARCSPPTTASSSG